MMEREELRARFLAGMALAAQTVNVVTTDGEAGRAGVTVSAMTSVSADTDRPTLMVCVHHLAAAAAAINANGVFCVNVLRDDQSYISDAFAGRFREQLADKFDCAEWEAGETGAPRVIDPLVAFDCRLVSNERVGTHFLFIGEARGVFVASRGSPLLYANRAYGAATRIQSAGSIEAGVEARDNRLAIGCFHTFGPHILPALIAKITAERPGLDISLIEGDQRRIQFALLAGEAEIALLYDLDLSEQISAETLAELRPYVLLPEGHPLAKEAAIAPADLGDYPMVLLDGPPSSAYFQSILEDAGVTPNIAFRSTSLEMVRGLVAHGLGYTLLSTRPANSVSYDGKALIARPLAAPTPPSQVALAACKGARLSGPGEEFAWACRDYFASDA